MRYYHFLSDGQGTEITLDCYNHWVAAAAAAAAAEADPNAAGLADAWLARHEGESVMMLAWPAD